MCRVQTKGIKKRHIKSTIKKRKKKKNQPCPLKANLGNLFKITYSKTFENVYSGLWTDSLGGREDINVLNFVCYSAPRN